VAALGDMPLWIRTLILTLAFLLFIMYTFSQRLSSDD
jgi:hypothetical protein